MPTTPPMCATAATRPSLPQVSQRDLERVLRERAAELGVETRRGWEVLAVSQDDDHVDVAVRTADGTETALLCQSHGPAGCQKSGWVLTSGDRWLDMIPACR